jgi:hypothetical protein
MRRISSIIFLAGMGAFLGVSFSTNASQRQSRIEKPNVERPQHERVEIANKQGRNEKPVVERNRVEKPKVVQNSPEKFIHSKSQFEPELFEQKNLNPNNSTQAAFPHANLHRKLRFYSREKTDYVNGPRGKNTYQPRFRHLDRGKMQHEWAF